MPPQLAKHVSWELHKGGSVNSGPLWGTQPTQYELTADGDGHHGYGRGCRLWRTASNAGTMTMPTTTGVYRFYFRFNGSLPAANVSIFTRGAQNGACLGLRASDSKLVAVVADGAGGSNLAAGPTIVADRWYRADLLIQVTAGVVTLDWQIDGAAQTQASLTSTLYSNIGYIGCTSTTPYGDSTTHDISFDDLSWTSTAADYPLGPCRTIVLYPNGRGTDSHPEYFADEGGNPIDANSYQHIDDPAPWDFATDADWLANITLTAGYLEFTLDDMATLDAGESVLGAALFAGTSTSAAASQGSFALRDAAGAQNNFSSDAYTSYPRGVGMVTKTNPVAGWSETTVNGLVIRMAQGSFYYPKLWAAAVEVCIATASDPSPPAAAQRFQAMLV